MKFVPKSLPSLEENVNVTPGSILKDALLLGTAFFVLTALALAVAMSLAEYLVTFVSIERENEIFSAADEFLPYAPAPPALQSAFDALREQSEYPAAIQLSTISDAEANAFALPGGRIIVSQGLLDEIESENELIFILAHELGHFEGRHHLRRIARQTLSALILQFIGISDAQSLSLELGQSVLESQYSQEDELFADRVGLKLLNKVYGHVRGFDEFFKKRIPEERSETSAFLRTHPLSRKRIDALKNIAQKQGMTLEGDLHPWNSDSADDQAVDK